MISVETFVEFVKKRDLGRMKFAIRDAHFDLDTTDEEGRTVLHHAILNGIEDGQQLQMARHLIGFGSDVNIRDETVAKEAPIHIALRLESLEAVKILLESASFDVFNCDTYRRQMLLRSLTRPTSATDPSSQPIHDSDDTKLKTLATDDDDSVQVPSEDAFLLIVHENVSSIVEDILAGCSWTLRLTDIVLLQDDCYITPIHDLLRCTDLATLSSLYVVDCRPQLEEDDIFNGVRLKTLVLSNTHLRRLPSSVFRMDCLEVLKVDRNSLEEVPEDVVRLRNLVTFCCDRQSPRLRTLPHCIGKMNHIQTLSISNNRLDDISWVSSISSLRSFHCDRNRIVRLPPAIVNLTDLMDVDISHNRLLFIPPAFSELISRLYRFSYYNVTLRPRCVLHDQTQLLAHLELEHFLDQSVSRPSVRDVTVAIVGESGSGKTTLVDAFNLQSGTPSSKGGAHTELQSFFTDASSVGDGGEPRFLSAIELSNGVMDMFSRNLSVDLYLLAVDLTAIQPHNGCQHLFARHVNRIQMWLQALYELSPETPVVLVGTHADQVRSASLGEVWNIIEHLLDHGRPHHARRFTDSRASNCLLCSSRHLAARRTMGKGHRTPGSGGTGSLGFVDLSLALTEPTANGHVLLEDHQPSGRHRFPHVVGYYEVEAKKLSRNSRKTSASVEQLKEAVVRLSTSTTSSSTSSSHHHHHHHQYRIPRSWVSFIRQATASSLTDDSSASSGMPFLLYDKVKALAKTCDVVPTQVQHMLHYFHRRGKLVYFNSDDDTLSHMIVVNTHWFIQRISQVMDVQLSSRSTTSEITQLLVDKELDDRLLKLIISGEDQHQQHPPVLSARWMLGALQKLEMCIGLQGGGVGSEGEDRLFLLPNLLEYGAPSHDVWPDNPEWEEKQITCDFAIRSLKPGLFSDLILRINREGRRHLRIVPDPIPVFLSHHIVFFSAFDQAGCDDCYNFRRRIRSRQRNEDLETADDVLHKVHVMFHARMDAVRVQVRGISPCCTMKAVLNFLELFLDDIPEEDYETSSDGASLSSQTTSSVSPSTSVLYSSDGHGSFGSLSHGGSENDNDDERDLFLLCPKCVLLRHSHPGRIAYHCLSPKRKAICRKWQNFGTWSRAASGADYRFSSVIEVPPTASLTMLPDYEHPRLVLILPPSPTVSNKDWYMFSRMKFLEGFEVHFLCEYTGFWHVTEDAGFRLNQSAQFTKAVGNQLPVLLNLALPLIQTIQGIPEHANNSRLVAPVVADLIKVYDYLRSVDPHIHDIYHWLSKNKDRVVNMLTKVLAAAGDGMPDLYFKVNNAINAHAIFQAPSSANRCHLAKYLHIDATSGRFGSLRPLYVEREIRWVCEAHYEELRSAPV